MLLNECFCEAVLQLGKLGEDGGLGAEQQVRERLGRGLVREVQPELLLNFEKGRVWIAPDVRDTRARHNVKNRQEESGGLAENVEGLPGEFHEPPVLISHGFHHGASEDEGRLFELGIRPKDIPGKRATGESAGESLGSTG